MPIVISFKIAFKYEKVEFEILEECLYDSYEDTRKFAVRKLKKIK
jgi:hypothetical protein